MAETKNAIIRGARIEIEDHGILTAWLDLDYGVERQGFGGFFLDSGNNAKIFIRRTMETVGVNRWNDLVGKTCRVRAEHAKVESIGHIVLDQWFCPREEFEAQDAN